ncbi:MAG TPA: hypothetical protein VLM17_04430 [Xanthomonadaceae bacterium]|nr:hypothetical protein [Xanthomonadaceae bacterium]
MNLSSFPRPAWATGLALAAALVAGPASAAPISGALFTTDAAANVNVNQYPAKTDVYLSGGPGPNAPCTAAGMDDGDYVFQITNPSGTVILSKDTIDHRHFTVTNGVIVSASDHAIVPSLCGGVGVQMFDFDDTPNNGGVYKAWVTRYTDYVANGNTFKPGSTKTDNFHVAEPSITPDTADLNVYKFYDANANGLWDPDEIPLFGWAMTASSNVGVIGTQLTQSPDGITTFSGLSTADNPYAVEEGTAGGTWHQSASIVNGAPTGSPTNPVTGLALVANQTTEVIFGNYCTCRNRGYTPYWWTTANGATKLNDGGTMTPEFRLLNGLHLRNANGTNFFLDTVNQTQANNYATLQGWLLGADDTNMAYLLSVHLAALRLNIEGGFVHRLNFFPAYGGTVADLLADADAALAADGNTPVGDPNRLLQEELKNFLIQLEVNIDLISNKPCKYSFLTAPAG